MILNIFSCQNANSMEDGSSPFPPVLGGNNRGDNFHGQVGWSSGQQDVAEDVSAHCRGVGIHGLKRSLPTKPLYHFMYFHTI